MAQTKKNFTYEHCPEVWGADRERPGSPVSKHLCLPPFAKTCETLVPVYVMWTEIQCLSRQAEHLLEHCNHRAYGLGIFHLLDSGPKIRQSKCEQCLFVRTFTKGWSWYISFLASSVNHRLRYLSLLRGPVFESQPSIAKSDVKRGNSLKNKNN